MADITNQQLLDSMTEQVGVIIKNELKAFATKDDLKTALKDYPTKQDLKNELKNELKAYATKDDLNDGLKALQLRLERRIADSQRINVQHHLATRKEIGGLNKDYSNLRDRLTRAADAIA